MTESINLEPHVPMGPGPLSPSPRPVALMSVHSPIVVWPFCDAPEEFRELSGHGGDEDWLAFVPDEYAEQYIPWLEAPIFGCCDVSEHKVDGGIVKIGAHA